MLQCVYVFLECKRRGHPSTFLEQVFSSTKRTVPAEQSLSNSSSYTGGRVGKKKKKTKIFPLFKCISCLPYCYRLCCGRPIYSPKKGKSTTRGRKTKLGKNRRKCGCHLAKQSRTNWAQKSPSLSEAAGSEQSTALLLARTLPRLCQRGAWDEQPQHLWQKKSCLKKECAEG